MILHKSLAGLSLVLALAAESVWAQAPLTVNGIADQGDYSDTVTFSVPSTSGYSYAVHLDGNLVPTDVSVLVTNQDYHQLIVWRTNLSSLQVTNRLVPFIVEKAAYEHTERGYPAWTPYPPVNATAAEFAGAQLRIITPQDYPLNLEIPVVAWVEKPDGSAVRAHAILSAPGQPSIQLFRGVGSGFLPAATSAGPLDYPASIPGVSTNKTINIESSTTWTSVSGNLSGAIDWPANSRISVVGHVALAAGSTLTIGEGTIVRLNSGVNITNDGQVVINGTEEQPVVFTPVTRAQPWGGFLMRTSTGAVDANNAIFVASGAQQSGFPGHKPQQPLFMIDKRPRLALTNCAAIYMAGQFGHATVVTTNASDPNWTVVNIVHSLVQHCVTAGEWNGCSLKLLNSAIIEMPFITSTFTNLDEDAIYFTAGEYQVANTLIGWTRDDGIDSGSNDGGSVTVSNNWHDSIFHEAFAWSGGGGTPGARRTTNIHCVAINCGQAYECGWSSGSVTPTPNDFVTDCVAIGNGVGARYGDNYTTGEGFTDFGFIRVTNSILLNNVRDCYGYNWTDWTYKTSAMEIRGNWLTAPNTNHPNNQIWNPASDGWRLAPFMSTPANAAVGIGLAIWTSNSPMSALFYGVPVGLSCFTTNFVSVNYHFEDDATTFASGTLTFAPGETIKRIYPAGFDVSAKSLVRVVLQDDPTNGELTGQTTATFTGAVPPTQVTCLVGGNQMDAARLGEGVAVTLNGPSAQPVTIDYKLEDGGQVLASGTLTFNPGETVKWVTAPGVTGSNYNLLRLSMSNPSFASLAWPSNYFLIKTLSAPPAPPAVTLVNSNSLWRYLDTGGDAGTAWRLLSYNDSLWSNNFAQLGFGDGDERTPIRKIGTNGLESITYYFRQTFYVTNKTDYASLFMWLLRDDGGVVYLNGTECYRSPSMPQLPTVITYQTLATNQSGTPPDNTVDTAALSSSLLVNGTNIVAVEIHQHDTASSDISFDFQLLANPAPPSAGPPAIYWSQFDRTNTVLGWSDPTYVLERANSLPGAYANPVSLSPVTVQRTNEQGYFRLRR